MVASSKEVDDDGYTDGGLGGEGAEEDDERQKEIRALKRQIVVRMRGSEQLSDASGLQAMAVVAGAEAIGGMATRGEKR